MLKLVMKQLKKRSIYLIDKAIDLIDEASAKVKLELYTEPDKIKNQKQKILEVQKEKEEAIKMQDFEKAAGLRDIERNEKETLEKQKNEWEEENNTTVTEITKQDVEQVVSNITGIPINRLGKTEYDKLKNLEQELGEKVVGQEEAIKTLSKAVKRARLGLNDPKRPIGSFLFLGPTGVR